MAVKVNDVSDVVHSCYCLMCIITLDFGHTGDINLTVSLNATIKKGYNIKAFCVLQTAFGLACYLSRKHSKGRKGSESQMGHNV